jgi:hypothetical protein
MQVKRRDVPDLVEKLQEELLRKEEQHQKILKLQRENPGMNVFVVNHNGQSIFYVHTRIEKPKGSGI